MTPGLVCLFSGENLALLIHLRPFTLHTDLRGIMYRAVGEFSGSDRSHSKSGTRQFSGGTFYHPP